jgi:hypothetical protein
VNKPRSIFPLTSPGTSGAFLFPNAMPCNVPAFPSRLPRAAALPAGLPLCPVRPLPPRLERAGAARPPVSFTAARAAAGDPGRRPSAAGLSLCRCFPCPVPAGCRAALGKPRPPVRPSAGDHRAAPGRPAGRRQPCRPSGRFPTPCPGRFRPSAPPPGSAATAAGRPPVIQAAGRRRQKGGLRI